MALLVTLFLVLVNIFNAITTNSPKADGLNALQAWVIACIFFIFGKWHFEMTLTPAIMVLSNIKCKIYFNFRCSIRILSDSVANENKDNSPNSQVHER